jgi:hypothetical protein
MVILKREFILMCVIKDILKKITALYDQPNA